MTTRSASYIIGSGEHPLRAACVETSNGWWLCEPSSLGDIWTAQRIARSTLLGRTKAVFNRRPITEPKLKIGLQYNTYSLQHSTYMEDLFLVSGEA